MSDQVGESLAARVMRLEEQGRSHERRHAVLTVVLSVLIGLQVVQVMQRLQRRQLLGVHGDLGYAIMAATEDTAWLHMTAYTPREYSASLAAETTPRSSQFSLEGRQVGEVAWMSQSEGSPRLGVRSAGGKAEMTVPPSGPVLAINDARGRTRAKLGMFRNGPALVFFDPQGRQTYHTPPQPATAPR